ncbi:MAG: rhomboid family intramembrane serine protease [Nitrospinota bacterium]
MFIPLKDDNPTRITPYVTFFLIGLNILGFFMEFQAPTHLAQRKLIYGMGAIPVRFTQDVGALPDFFLPAWMTLFTSLFLHAGFVHLGGNMLYLWIFGNNIEEYLGHARFAMFYLVSGVAATWAHILIDPSSQIPLIGASGAIAGVLGAYLVLYPRHKVVCLIVFFFIQVVRIPALWVLGFWFVIQLFRGTMSLGLESSGGVAWFAHIGGFVVGLVLIRLAGKMGWNAYKRWW